MTSPVAFGPYSSVQQYVKTAPSWVPPAHQARVGAYQVYTEIYWSHISQEYKVMNRGLDAEDQPVYVPSSRIMVDTLNRYVGPKLGFQADPATGTPEGRLEATTFLTDLFARERFASRYAAAKRSGIIKGDFGWHITADPAKPEGSRLSINTFKPENYYPVFEDETVMGGDPDKMVMVVLAELVMVGEDQRVRTQRYWREDNGLITSSVDLWEPDKWYLWRYDDDAADPVANVIPATPLPAAITQFPVYHVPVRPEDGETFGNSPMRGLEVLQAALNQSVTDEDLALALMGLGVYATEEAGRPIGRDGEPVDWLIYPGMVIENAKGLRKVEGLTGLQAYTEHVGRLEGYVGDASGATDAARGRIEVAEAESGIALQLRLAPTLALAEEQDQIILDVARQMFYDLLTMWLPTYEAKNFTDITLLPTLGDKLPVNRKAEAEMVNSLVLTNVLSAASARNYLIKRGFTDLFQDTEGDLILAEIAARAAVEGGDGLADREAGELAAGGGEDGGEDEGV